MGKARSAEFRRGVVIVSDKRTSKSITVVCDEVIRTSGTPPRTVVVSLEPRVTSAILASYDEYLSKANSPHFVSSVSESMGRGNLALVAKKILYYECTGNVLPLG